MLPVRENAVEDPPGGEPVNRHLDLVRELKALRKGRGVLAGRIGERVGPSLRATCGIVDADGPVAIRQKVTSRLTELIERLPEDLRLVTLAAFAINAEARLPLYQDRVQWSATKVDRDSRTVRRRVDEAIGQLAELAVDVPLGRAGGHVCGWRTTELRVAVALDGVQPEVLEQRRIVVGQDGLRELDLAACLPVGRRDLDVCVLYGGTLLDRGTGASDRFDFGFALPAPACQGESHDFAVRFRLSPEYPVPPYLVCVPRHPWELFDLRVRFGRDRVPRRVWTLHGAYQRDESGLACDGDQHPVDQAGEIHLRFRHLTPGLAYGARWEAENWSPALRRAGI